MGFLGSAAGSTADITLLVQIAGFVLLLSGTVYVKKGNLARHFTFTRVAVLLGVFALIWMALSLISQLQYLILDVFGTLLLLHVSFGTAALISGVLFAFDRVIRKTKMPMRSVFILWFAALLLGISFYLTYYNVLVLF